MISSDFAGNGSFHDGEKVVRADADRAGENGFYSFVSKRKLSLKHEKSELAAIIKMSEPRHINGRLDAIS